MFGFCNVFNNLIKKLYIFLVIVPIVLLSFNFCGEVEQAKNKVGSSDTLTYLNHSDSVKYVGMNTCKLCHQNIYNTFIKTGMGKSFDVASKIKSSARFEHSTIYDASSDFDYHAFWSADSLFIKEFRLNKKDTTHLRTEQVNYIIGSGQHTNSHLQVVNGYVNQMPMTFYTQKKKWDLPPGFENGVNTRFSRKIGLECMSCHNAYPGFVKGSENKYTGLPSGIDCERCHGPGSEHVKQRQAGEKVDTSKYIDYSIVNPAKLSIDAQFDICQRCHLQGNAVLKEGKSFFDFKPGQKLSNFISVFIPKYKNADKDFIMASHADRLKQSACFIKSYEKVKNKNALKPYREALTCVTCHNPHVSVRETNKEVFNDACVNCHKESSFNKEELLAMQKANCSLSKEKKINCVSCHMPVSGSIDIPHVSVHDHYIRKPITETEKNKIKEFIGLYSINEKNPDKLTRAKAYINQYEKFEQILAYLDSAEALLSGKTDEKKIRSLIQLNFIKGNYGKILELMNQLGEQNCLDKIFVKSSFNNTDAWTCYWIAEAFFNKGEKEKAIKWFSKAANLAPYNLDFRNKLATTYASSNNLKDATAQFEFILRENPKFVSAYSNLGYIKMLEGFPAEAKRLYLIGQSLDPDNEALLLNLAAYYMFVKDKESAKKELEKILHKNPSHQKARFALKELIS